jgi:hypothetical protein
METLAVIGALGVTALLEVLGVFEAVRGRVQRPEES